ncbi:T9SS type A sorting domain-containing protein [Chitinophaga barathri]|uniref:T9SS C-terminal target domain-containing protein n=1 Tax=Chitinophaga barathri TaxID=1647451 RepID=A0A3N4N261_9BACT|nr:T9SS type A sorting domain-containing protein [Chitinophaga barathri]RPD41713.1 T9SS C-terminal target domain-containing protein [Chitinophaga barathri]
MKTQNSTQFLSIPCTLILLFTLLAFPSKAQLVSIENGRIVYGRYANQGQSNEDNQVPDFSNAGYHGGGMPLPVLAATDSIQPVEGDNRAHIQAAIDRIAALAPDANGMRGVLLLKAGIYPVEGVLNIRAGGVVLRGEGNGLNGTILVATQKTNHNFIQIRGSGSGYGEISASRARITTPFVGTGARSFDVAAGHSFQPGDRVIVIRTPNQAWIDTLKMAQYGWTASGYKTEFEREVVSVSGNTLTLDAPVMDPMETAFGGGEVVKTNISGRIKENGVENMRLESAFADNEDESHAWIAIIFSRAEQGWVKNVTGKFFGYGLINLSTQTRHITVEDCAMIDAKSVTTGGRKYSFAIESGSNCNLIQRCMTWGGRHDLVTGSQVPGPNVFLDCASENTKDDIGPHHRWATGLLFDNIYGGRIRVQNRGASGTGHGWAGAQTMFWNAYSYQSDVEVESPIAGRNWGIGVIGQKKVGNGYWESWGAHVLPRSLYLQQLEERLGAQAVQYIATPEQLQGRLWDTLRARSKRIAAEAPVRYAPADTLSSFDITDHGGAITAQYPNTSKPSEDVPSLIDNNTATKYYRSGRTALWVQYQSVKPAIVTSYTITSANDVAERDPKDWNLAGSNDGVTWAVLDSQVNRSFSGRRQRQTFRIDSNRQVFLYYRLNITANNGHTGTQFAEWELFERRQQNISFSEPPELTYGDEPFELVAGSTSGLPVTMEVISGPGVIVDSLITITGGGTILIRAGQAGNDRFFPATAEISITVQKATQDVTFAELPVLTYGDVPVPVTAASSAGLPVTLDVVAGPGVLNDSLLALNGAGVITVRGIQAGNDNYLPDTTEIGIVVNKAVQTIAFGPISPKLKFERVNLSAAASSGLPVSFGIVSGTAELTGNSLRFTAEGPVTIRARQPGNDNFLAADSVEQTILVLGLGYLRPEINAFVYPNPTSGQFKVRISNASDKDHTFLLFDHRGNVVASAVNRRGPKMFEVPFNISNMQDGIYYLHISDGADKVIRVIVKF